MASLWCVRDKESTQIYQVLYASLKPGMDKAEATPDRDHSPSQHPQRRESQLRGSVYFDWRCVAFWKVRSVPLAIFIPQSLRSSPSSGQATPALCYGTLSSLPATQVQRCVGLCSLAMACVNLTTDQ